MKGSNSDVFRVSISSHGSAGDDCDTQSDVYIWGEVICDTSAKVGASKNAPFVSARADVLLPRPLESNVVFDIHHIACGVTHAALVTRQGELFTWGEESGGRLGHGVGNDILQPSLVEHLAIYNVDSVACGEFHSCAVTTSGELYSWGDGTHNVGLLGNGTDFSHWIPKRIVGPLEELKVGFVTCGTWHTALITTTGQLFTFGDGTFGVLGHGNRESVSYPKEVEALSGLRTIHVACGVWHTAAVVEVIVTHSSSAKSSGKLFTWGDGDKHRLGQGDKEPRLKPTCVSSLIENDFHKVACGHSLTVGLTISGLVYTMGSTVYGQLGNPLSGGKVPCLVEDNLLHETVEEIACGAYHVAVLTSRDEVYTWGKGENGRLGHGNTEDQKTPTMVEALRDRHVKYIACGSTFTAAICLHKWVYAAEQCQCVACRQTFGFTRKRHNCYNCGLVHCHSCSSRKTFGAALAPNLNKAYRVCDSCFAKLGKVSEAGGNGRKNNGPRLSGENKDKLDKAELRLAKATIPNSMELIKQLDAKALKQVRKVDTLSQAPSLLQLKDVILSVNSKRAVTRSILTRYGVGSRPVSPFSRKSSPPRSATPVPISGPSFSKSIADSLKKTNELLNQEILKLRDQVDSLKQRCAIQEAELQTSAKKYQEAMSLSAEESAKTKAAKEAIKSLTAQLKDMAERLHPGRHGAESMKQAFLHNSLEPNGVDVPDEQHRSSDATNDLHLNSLAEVDSTPKNRTRISMQSTRDLKVTTGNVYLKQRETKYFNGRDDQLEARTPIAASALHPRFSDASETSFGSRDTRLYQNEETGTRLKNPGLASVDNQVGAEWIEQYEPGVYITLVALRDGTRDLKRVRFSRRRFGENQAEAWWSENRVKVNERYNVRGSDKPSVSAQTNGI